MNWKLIFTLSLFGLAMAFATLAWIPSNKEFIYWLVIFIICAFVIAKNAPGNYFWHGFMVSIFNCIWITAVHLWMHTTYLNSHPEMAQMNDKMPEMLRNHPIKTMLMIGPFIGVICGMILGLFSWIASIIVKKSPASA